MNPSIRNTEGLANQLGVSPRQISKLRTVLKGASDEEKAKIKSGETSVNQAYNRVRGIGNDSPTKKETTKCKFCDESGKCTKYKEVQNAIFQA